MKKRRGRVEKCELLVHKILVQRCHNHHKHIDYDYVLDSRRHIRHKTASVFV